MAGESAEEVGELPAMLVRLQREGDGAGRAAFEIGTQLAEDCLLQGRFEEAAQRLLALAEQGRQQRRDAMRNDAAVSSLILALTELDRLDQAREVVVEAMPLVRWFGLAGRTMRLSWPCSRHGAGAPTPRRACWLRVRHAGHASADASSSSERHAEQKVRGLLAAAQTDDQLSAWFREGAALNDEEFDRLVMHEA